MVLHCRMLEDLFADPVRKLPFSDTLVAFIASRSSTRSKDYQEERP